MSSLFNNKIKHVAEYSNEMRFLCKKTKNVPLAIGFRFIVVGSVVASFCVGCACRYFPSRPNKRRNTFHRAYLSEIKETKNKWKLVKSRMFRVKHISFFYELLCLSEQKVGRGRINALFYCYLMLFSRWKALFTAGGSGWRDKRSDVGNDETLTQNRETRWSRVTRTISFFWW